MASGGAVAVRHLFSVGKEGHVENARSQAYTMMATHKLEAKVYQAGTTVGGSHRL
jgi:hypothetical protein